jgi:enoyl-CoA hydratase/carnithine racemase
LGEGASRSEPETARVDSEALAELGMRPDAAEGVTAFLEKRTPRFESQVPADLPRSYPLRER